MPDDSDRTEPEGRVISLPRSGEAYVPPPAARYADAARGAADTTARAPEIPAAPQPPEPAAFRAEPIPAPAGTASEYEESETEYDESEYGEYSERRTFAEVISEWLQHLVDSARQNRDENAAFREAQVADKVARLNAETEREMGLLAQHNELRKAQLGARAAHASAAAGGKGPGSANAGHWSGPGPANRGSSGGPGSGPLGGRSSGSGGGRDGGGAHHRPGERHSEGHRQTPKGPSAPFGPRGQSQGAGGGLTGRQNHSGGSHGSGGPGPSGKSGPSGGAGAARGGSSGGERPRTWSGAAAERSQARQERRAARQSADLADRTKDRDSGRAHRERVRDDDYARKQRRKKLAEESGSSRVDLARALLEGWRRKAEAKLDEASSKPEDAPSKPEESGPKSEEAFPKSEGVDPKPGTAGPEADLTKDKDRRTVPGADPETGTGSGPETGDAAETGADDAFGGAKTGDGWTEFLRTLHDTNRADKETDGGAGTGDGWREFLRNVSDQHPPGPGPDPEPETVSAGNPDMAPRRPAESEDDVPDAEIVVPELTAKGSAAADPAPESHSEQPGAVRTAGAAGAGPLPGRPWSSASQRMAREHQTEVTFSEFLITMANIKVNSAQDAEKVQNAVDNLTVWAHRLKRMCAELGGSHNLDRKVIRLLDALAAMSESTAVNADRLARAVHTAAQKAEETAKDVARIYQEDLDAMREGGVEQASAAVHHHE
ncbi:hypothetical protein [Streptomyces sp. TLI_171]|uniref:hypothetical protein n=1 Tax=Streptomyces sp. TLI_171 TaxID=1938859 RepID=UPI000C1A7238|nr:hypothetical protein [Streptomyces sp. TLI_171]RKE02940.1 hypothetical protein BX266_7543 [Streptomyces sp. TLI_171]